MPTIYRPPLDHYRLYTTSSSVFHTVYDLDGVLAQKVGFSLDLLS